VGKDGHGVAVEIIAVKIVAKMSKLNDDRSESAMKLKNVRSRYSNFT